MKYMANAGVQANQTGTGLLSCMSSAFFGPLEKRLKFKPENLGLKN